MNEDTGLPRRTLLLRLLLGINALVVAGLGVPIAGYVLAPILRKRREPAATWISLGALEQFPEAQTRLASYQHPGGNSWDGETANVPCWVRRVDPDRFQVFAINCAHLGCPVRWFPQSGLFLCPCHGGAYYEDGSRASGPPERGLFEYPFKIERGELFIQAGDMPTPGGCGKAPKSRSTCA